MKNAQGAKTPSLKFDPPCPRTFENFRPPRPQSRKVDRTPIPASRFSFVPQTPNSNIFKVIIWGFLT